MNTTPHTPPSRRRQRVLMLALLVAMTAIALPAATVWADRLGRWALLPLGLTVLYALALPLIAAWMDGFRELRRWFDPASGVVGGWQSPRERRLALALMGVAPFLPLLLLANTGSRAEMAESLLISALCLMFLPALLVDHLLHRRHGSEPPLPVLWKASVAAALVACLLLLGGYALVAQVFGPEWVDPAWTPWAVLVSVGGPVVYAALHLWRGHSVARWRERLEQQTLRAQVAENARQAAEMELALLQAQIEPHFLYNTLASVQYLVERDARGASFLLTQLIRYLRQSMPAMRGVRSTLGREFELVDAYLQIAKIRMGARLRVEVELAEPLQELPMPPLLVQTLVENALKHGVEPKLGEVSVRVGARRLDDGRVEITVEDDGVGLGGAPTAGSGTGLRNVRLRLQTLYGERASLSLQSASGSGVVARIVLPAAPPGSPAPAR